MPSFHSFPKIDAHIHFNANRTNLLKLAEEFGFSLLTINTEVPDFPSIDQQQQLAIEYDKSSDVDLHYASTISTEHIFDNDWAQNAIDKIEKDIAKGACGVKFWKNIGMAIQRPDGEFIMLDDPELEPVFSFLEEENITVLGHQGEPKNCWLPVDEMTVQSDKDYFSNHPEYHMYLHDEYPDYQKHIDARDAILDRHPNLQFIGLHLASLEWSLDEVAARLDRYPHLAVDLAERISHLYYHAAENQQKVIDFFEQYQDRIIYGTDIINAPNQPAEEVDKDLQERWKTHWKFLATDQAMTSPQVEQSFRGLNLPETILEKVYRANAIKWYNL